MPSDKQNKPSSITSKPLTPALSSNFRNGKPAITPRLAGSASASATPSASSSPGLASRKEPFVRSKSPAKNEHPTTPLSNNVTPRSGARRSRIGVESPSTPAPVRLPNTTAASKKSPVDEGIRTHTIQSPGLGMTNPRLNMSTTALPNPHGPPASNFSVHRRVSAAKSMVEGTKESSKFFHANEAKPPIVSPATEDIPRLPPNRAQHFVGSPPLRALSPVPTSATPKDEERDSKFFRVNDVTQQSLPRRAPLAHINAENLTDIQKLATGQIEDSTNMPSSRATPPSSPVRPQNAFPLQPTSPRKYVPINKEPTPPKARSSFETPTGTVLSNGHRKSTSASSVTAAAERPFSGPRSQPQPLDLHFVPSGSPRSLGNNMLSPETSSPRSISLASSNTIPTSAVSDIESSEITKPTTLVTNLPVNSMDVISSPSHSHIDDAANARRERKVLDLEISNSSLLAINKTLERELRKQSAELRRFRRLSRSGRLSMAPTTRSASGQSNFSLGTVTEIDSQENDEFSESDEENDLDSLGDENDSLVSSESGSLMSQSARSRQRARDEKRLMLDLSKHQQLLVDSQKLSQSIKRCLTCTEELIRDGNKALDYRVGIGDVKLGGRVLNDEELDERGLQNGDDEPLARQGLLSPSLVKSQMSETQTWDLGGIPSADTGFPALDQMTELLEEAAIVLGERPATNMH